MDKYQNGAGQSDRYTSPDVHQRSLSHAVSRAQKTHEATRQIAAIAIVGAMTIFPVLGFRPVRGEEPTIAAMLSTNATYRGSLPKQLYSAALTRAAKNHAEYMAKTGDFAHRGANGTPGIRTAKAGYDGDVGENIARGYTTLDDVFKGWRSSQSHWDMIQGDYSEVGFGIATAQDGTIYWVVLYGNPSSSSALARKSTTPQ